MGGGTILILLLSIFMNVDQRVAQATNLVFYIPTAISSIIIGIKNKNINIKQSYTIVIAGIIGATLSANISSYLNVQILKKLFGFFLLIIAIYEIYLWYHMHIKNKKGHTKNRKNIKRCKKHFQLK